jgi:hypothetical protein
LKEILLKIRNRGNYISKLQVPSGPLAENPEVHGLLNIYRIFRTVNLHGVYIRVLSERL